MIKEKADRMLRFYTIKLGEGLSEDAALDKVKRKFSPSAYELAALRAIVVAHETGGNAGG